ncbi:hypothetical protein [Nostoc sp. UIC 10630]|uniref:hypothetical protein n=1 Tax=Nostoc sp. UIC 10630 TaxID=2100146 RepID=UPI0013D606B0|nr:hypothetical protein [Nostoc sp. UIC 10630]NEU79053.1 hypothetical protein [Nostoc sp. UIC 10630]
MSQLAKAENPNNPILNDSTRGRGQGEKEQGKMIPAPCCGVKQNMGLIPPQQPSVVLVLLGRIPI